jgi:hypothetical protein
VKGSLARTRWAAIGAAVAVSLGGGTLLVANAASPGVGFKSITPCRLLDTRLLAQTTEHIRPTGIWYGKIGNNASLSRNDITVIFDKNAKRTEGSDNNTFKFDASQASRPIMGDCDGRFADPAGVDLSDTITALALNVTVSEISADSFMTIYPWTDLTPGAESNDRPLVSNLNPLRNAGIVFNTATVNLAPLPAGFTPPGVKCAGGDFGNSNCQSLQAFRVYNHAGTNQVIIDVMGYYYIE